MLYQKNKGDKDRWLKKKINKKNRMMMKTVKKDHDVSKKGLSKNMLLPNHVAFHMSEWLKMVWILDN